MYRAGSGCEAPRFADRYCRPTAAGTGLLRRRTSRADEAKLAKLTATPGKNGELAQLVEVQDRIAATERRQAEITDELNTLVIQPVSQDEVAAMLAEFDRLWSALTPRERVQVLKLLIERIHFDGQWDKLDITFRPTGIKTFVAEMAEHEEHAA